MQYLYDLPPAIGVPKEVVPGVFWLRVPLPFRLDHINLWLLKDGDGWVIVDSGLANDEVRSIWTRVLAQLGGPITKLLVTHFHPDHLGLATWLMERTGVQLFMTAAEFLTAHAAWNEVGGHGIPFMVEQFRQHGMDKEGAADFERRGSAYRRGVSTVPNHYNRLLNGDEIVIGEYTWRVVVGYGHSPEHAALYCQELDVLISGDMLLPKITTNISVFAATPTADPLGWYLGSLEKMARDFPGQTMVLPSHGLPFKGVQTRVRDLCAHHDERLNLLEETCEAPKSAAGVLETLFPRPLETHEKMFAMGEAIAHLNHLEKAGRLSKTIDADGVIRYKRILSPTASH